MIQSDEMALLQQYRQQADTLRHVMPATDLIDQLLTGSPFETVSARARAAAYLRHLVLGAAERLLGAPLYAENAWRELATLEPRARALLARLIERGVVTSWRIGAAPPDRPYVATCRLHLKPIRLPSGTLVSMGGNTGGGTGPTPSDALVPALAELLERYAAATWDTERIVRGSYTELQDRGAIDPQELSFFSPAQRADPEYARHRVDFSASLDWTRAMRLADDREVLVPAQAVYMFYSVDHPDQPVFWDVNSNGVAAATTYAEAAYRAILEAIERDAFLLFWLNRLTPPRVRHADVPDAQARRLLEASSQLGTTIHLLDCTSDIGVPVFVGVAIDPDSAVPVSVSAAADLDAASALRKLVYELAKFSHGTIYTDTDTLLEDPADIVSMGQRQRWWCAGDWRAWIAPLIAGEERPYEAPQSQETGLKPLARKLREQDLSCYIVDVTNQEAREAGLVVVRALMPDLIPIYFREAKRYLGVPRIYTAPRAMGYDTGVQSEHDLNPVPHPFL